MDEDLLYSNHFGLIAKPFQDICDRRFIWLGDRQLENLAHLKLGIEEKKGILILLGDEGSGRSVLLERLLRIIAGDFTVAILREPRIEVPEFYDFLADEYGIQGPIAAKGDFLISFKGFLLEAQAAGRKVLLVAEDAENQDDEILEQLRLFSNMEENGEKLLSILLIGNQQLNARLSEHRHRALLQRATVRCHAEPLSAKETAAYIRHRMMVAGSFLEIFTAEAVAAIHALSGGIPKLINLVCDHALMRGYFEKLRKIDGRVIAGYAKEIRKGFGPGRGGRRSTAWVPWKSLRDSLDRSWSSKWFPATLALAAGALLAVGVPLIAFKEKPQVVVQPVFPALVSIYFEAGSTRLSARDFPRLDQVAESLAQSPQSRVFVKGYTDSQGSAAHNMRISAARAEAAREYLVQKGVEPARIQAMGLGPRKPAGGGQSPEDPKLSRRVEIEVVAK
jgi:type II secretory pathway predicted ATPase ExeA/outer membrane protein OmpA-like peptidoglycan-associated protein